MLPETRYARLGELHLAYQVIGDGPPDILLLDQWFGNLDAQWDVPPLAALRERLATFGRLIMFDKRGTGLSDPIPTSSLPTLEEFMADIPAVLDTVGSERAALIANIGGGILAMPFAAAHPDRVSSLILVDCFARFLEAPDFPIGAPIADARAGARNRGGRHRPRSDDRPVRTFSRRRRADAPCRGRGTSVPRRRPAAPRRSSASSTKATCATSSRRSASRRWSSTARRPWDSASRTGGTSPTHIPDAKYVELPGTDNLIWAGDQDAIVAEIQDFVTGVRPVLDPRRVLATADVHRHRRIDAAGGRTRRRAGGSALLADHNRVVRHQLERFGGTEIKVIGDGFLATFDGPARAVRCAAAIRDEVKDLGLEIRAGLHVGEVEVVADDIAGLAVHIAAQGLGKGRGERDPRLEHGQGSRRRVGAGLR